ncbi:hypothetical protein [Motilibacter deserti]|uniref:Chlorophyllase-like protein n=1 Tax=Motilibacter deserti TaxID=2714956 RepID=A0ABX0GT99_9ACTN|nr:hypothetical protein [Motilibacter deserti]NHC14111.1 hypothetical protein [Motilibacter deserti]
MPRSTPSFRAGRAGRASRLTGLVLAVAASAVLPSAPTLAAAAPVAHHPAASGLGWRVTATATGGSAVTLDVGRLPVRDALPWLVVDGRPVGPAVLSDDGRRLSAVTDRRLVGVQDVELAWSGSASAPSSSALPSSAPLSSARQPSPGGPGGSPGAGTAAARTSAAVAADGVSTRDYDLGDEALPLSSLGGARVELRGRAYWPEGLPGRRHPVVVLLHGRHEPCYVTDPEHVPEPVPLPEWPCPDGWSPVPSYGGYDDIGNALAAAGHVVVSVSANAVNALDHREPDAGAQARADLVLATLDLLARWDKKGDDPLDGVLDGELDLHTVGLLGHSRGGEGVVLAALANATRATPYGIRAVLPLAPTDFLRLTLPGTAMSVLLPYCDGDVLDLQGAHLVDDTRYAVTGDRAPRSALLVHGANHNFFNTEWTPGLSAAPSIDDWEFADIDNDDPTCGAAAPTRLAAAEQRAVGAGYAEAFFRLHLADERSFLPYFDGSAARPAGIGRAVVDVAAAQQPADERLDLARFDESVAPAVLSGAVTGEICGGALAPGIEEPPGTGTHPLPPCTTRTPTYVLPDWGPSAIALGRPASPALHLRWSGHGSVRVPLSGPARRADRYDALVLRAAPGETATAPVPLVLRLTDTRGRTTDLPVPALSPALTPLPGEPPTGELDFPILPKLMLRQVHVSLDEVRGVDLHRLAAVEILTPDGTGEAYIADLAFASPDEGRPAPTTLPQVSVGDVTEAEGDSGTRTLQVPVRLSRPSSVPVSMWVDAYRPLTGELAFSGAVDIAPGTAATNVPIEVTGNTVDDGGFQEIVVVASGVEEAAVADPLGLVRLVDEEPPPLLTVSGFAEAVEPPLGLPDEPMPVAYLAFPAHLSAPSGLPVEVSARAAGGTATEWYDYAPIAFLDVPAGETEGSLLVPVFGDEEVEPDESVLLELLEGESYVLDGPASLFGVIRDAG